MKVLFNDFISEYNLIKNRIDSAVRRVLESGYFILGSELEAFEKEFASYCGAKYCAGVGSGTDALMIAMKALDIGHGDYVITVTNTAIPTVSAISYAGAEPVLVDVNDKTMLMDGGILESSVKKLPAKIRKKLRAVICVHLYGAACPVREIKKAADKYGLKVIEDCAQSHGAETLGEKTGAIGDVGCFSFYPTKNLGCYGDAGAVTTNDKTIYERVVKLRNHGQEKRYLHVMRGITSRFDEIQAAILKMKLPFIEEWNVKRNEIQKKYRKGLSKLPVRFQSEPEGGKHVYHLFVIRTERRDELQRHLDKNGIQTLIHYPIPAHLQECYRYLGHKKGDFPVSEKAAGEILSIPVSPFLKDDAVEYVIKHIKGFLS